MKAPQESSLADRLELHREKMRNKAGRRDRWHRIVSEDRAKRLAASNSAGTPVRYNSTSYLLRGRA